MSKRLSVTHLSTSLDLFGVWDVVILINDKEYTYSIYSEYGYRMFIRFLNVNRPGKAINTLKRFSIKEKENEKRNG